MSLLARLTGGVPARSLWGLGLLQLVRYRRRTRAELLALDPDVRSKMVRLG